MLKTSLGRLRVIGFAEGLSFVLLLFVAMPLKYGMQMPQPVRVLGSFHGLFFILYVWAVIQMKFEADWSIKKTFLALVASVIPFGTFWADKHLFLKGEEEKKA